MHWILYFSWESLKQSNIDVNWKKLRNNSSFALKINEILIQHFNCVCSKWLSVISVSMAVSFIITSLFKILISHFKDLNCRHDFLHQSISDHLMTWSQIFWTSDFEWKILGCVDTIVIFRFHRWRIGILSRHWRMWLESGWLWLQCRL